MDRVMDCLLSVTMNVTVIALIVISGGGALMLGYWGLVELCNGRPVPGGISVVISVIPAAAALKLARYKNDLADR